MSSTPFIWMPERPGAAWAWLDTSGQQGWAVTREDQQDLVSVLGANAHIVIPGQWVRMFTHDLPKMRQSDRLSAAGFSIEDDLAAPVSEQHIILGKGEDRRIGVIAKDKMDFLTQDLSSSGLSASGIYTDFDIISGDDPIDVMDRTIHPGPVGYTLDNDDMTGRHPALISGRLDLSSALNFGQGAYAQRRALSFSRGPWLRIAAMFVATALAWMVWQGVQARGISAQAETLREDMKTLYTDATGEPAPPNLVVAVNRAARSGQTGGGDFLIMSRDLFAGLSNADEVVIDTMRYDSRRNEISLRLIYPSFETAGQVEAVFTERGHSFVSGSVREQGDILLGEAVFSSGGGS